MEKKQSFFKKYGNDYFFLCFWLSSFLIFTVIPIIASLFLSFTNFDMVQTPKFVGIDNYLRLFLDDDIFITSLMKKRRTMSAESSIHKRGIKSSTTFRNFMKGGIFL